MKALVAGLVGLVAWAGPVVAQAPPDCGSAEDAIGAVFPMPRAAKEMASSGQIRVLVMGAGSSTLPGPDGPKYAYPARLQPALARRLSGITVSVATDVTARRTAADMAGGLKAALATAKASVLVWQTGTTDAMRNVNPEDFSAALDRGIDIAHAAGADVIFMNMQHSPRTESMIAVAHYAEAMRWVALQREVSLFDRFSLMKTWSELGKFRLRHAPNKLDTARRVHDCIADLLGELLVVAIRQGGAAKETR
jgi:hypothetical protein